MTRRTIVALQRGASDKARVVFEHGSEVRRVVVGSSTLCDWRIAARGLRARHACLVWNGHVLSLGIEGRRANVLVDGRTVAHRCELMAKAKIQLGDAILDVSRIVRHGDATPSGQGGAASEAETVHAPPVPHEDESSLAPELVRAEDPDETLAGAGVDDPSVGPGAIRATGGDTTLIVPLDCEPPERSSTMDTVSDGPAEERHCAARSRGGFSLLRRRIAPRVVTLGGLTLVAGAALAFAICALVPPGAPTAGALRRRDGGASIALARDGRHDELEPRSSHLAPIGSVGHPRVDAGAGDAGAADPSLAARYLLGGQHVEALAAYRQLAELSPESRVYADLISILEREIGRRCVAARGGRGCGAL